MKERLQVWHGVSVALLGNISGGWVTSGMLWVLGCMRGSRGRIAVLCTVGDDVGLDWRPQHRTLAGSLRSPSMLPAGSGQGQKAGRLGLVAANSLCLPPSV